MRASYAVGIYAIGVAALLATGATAAPEVVPDVPEKAVCTVCARRAAGHGPEAVAAWRQYEGNLYTFCAQSCAQAFDQMPEGYATPKLPRSAPEVNLRTLAGETFPLVEAGSRATLVDFWATWCAPCLEMMPTLSRLYEERSDEGFRVVGISIDEDREKLERFLSKKAPAYPVVHDGGDDPAWWAFRVPAIPAAFLLDARGRIVAQWGVDFSEAALREALGSLGGADHRPEPPVEPAGDGRR